MTNAEQPKPNISVLINTVRIVGAVFMLASVVIGFNAGGLAAAAGVSDETVRWIVGAVLFAAGMIDFFVFPVIIARKVVNKPDSQA